MNLEQHRKSVYAVYFNSNVDTLAHFSRLFNTKRAAIKWANWLAAQKFTSFAQVWRGESGGELVYEKTK